MKIKQQIKSLWMKKSTKYMLAGILCLMAVVLLLTLNAAGQVSAADVMLGGNTISLDTDSNGAYLIRTADNMRDLGRADSIETSGKKFILANDINMGTITSAANGTFAGVFDGQGHVITISSVVIDNAESGEVSQGVLFGNVSGAVQNLIVDIQGDARYTRNSVVERVDTESESQIVVNGEVAEAPTTGLEFSKYSSDAAAKDVAAQLDVATLTNIFIVNGTEYRRVSANEEITKTTTYELEEAGTDQFGILCGTLAENGIINQVYVKGNTLNVLQKADLVATTITQEGTREKYFYYGVEKKDFVEDDTLNAPSSTVTGETISVYNASEDDNTTNVSNANVSMQISSPKYIEKNGEISYTIKVENNESSAITINDIVAKDSSDATQTGTWKKEDGTDIDDTEKTILPGSTKTYKYTLSERVSDTVTTNITLLYPDVNGGDTPNMLTTSLLTSVMVDTNEISTNPESGTGLKLTLTPSQVNCLVDSATGFIDVDYTLRIQNNLTNSFDDTVLTVSAGDIVFEIDGVEQSVEWKLNGNSFSEKAISIGETITLVGTVSFAGGTDVVNYIPTTTIKPSKKENVYENVNVYSYISNITGIDGLHEYGTESFSGTLEETGKVYSGNHLNAGIFVGTSKGTITESKQNMQIDKEQESIAQLQVGGVIGQALSGARASHLYLLGEASYAGNSSDLPGNSATASTVTMPATDGKWASYTKYDTSDLEERFDLSWLVKENTNFNYSTVDSNNEIEVSFDGARMTDKELDYIVTYNVRKDMTETSEDNVYVTYDGALELGNSGFYRLLNTYATDGYYHYSTNAVGLEDAEWVYPYSSPVTMNPYVIKNEDVTVVRLENPLRDVIQIQTAAGTGTIYYNVNSKGGVPNIGNNSTTKTAIIENGVVQLQFEMESVYYQITQVIDGHIYPTQITREITQAERQGLPKPEVKCYDYYNVNEVLNPYIDLVENGYYEAGTDIQIVPTFDVENAENYTFRYLYATTAPASGEWDEEHRYIGSNTSFMDSAEEYEYSAEIPRNLINAGKVYLYVEMEKKNFANEIFYYGPFSVIEKNELLFSLTSNGQIIDDDTLVDGDIVLLSGAPQNASIEYMLSTTPVDSYIWQTYSNTGILMKMSTGSYLYARINYGNGKYSEVYTNSYVFGETCEEPRVTPNTGISSLGESAAAIVGSGSNVSLNVRTANGQIFYLVSEETKSIDFERVVALPADITKDGDIGSDGSKYFEVDGRWYRTSFTELERYRESIMLSHDESDAQLRYLSAVAVANGYEVSDIVEYLYVVEEKHKVAAPEATFETRYMPGGENNEIASIAAGSNISFFTVTADAELYYAIGTGTTAPSTPIPGNGIMVEGNYNSNFIVRIQAKKEGMLDSDIITFVYRIAEQETVDAPTATPGTTVDNPTVVIPGNKILLSSTTRGASIYYTTDGTVPKVRELENGTYEAANKKTFLYDPNTGIEMPLDGEGFFTISSIAVKSGLANSAETRLTYAYPSAVSKPYANVEAGKVELNTSVYLKNLTEGATIYYTIAYGDSVPEEPTFSSAVFNNEYPFVVTQKMTIKAMAAKDGVKSSVVSFVYEPLQQFDVPKASIESGSVVSSGTLLSLTVANGATIYYTMDGSDPTDSTNMAVMSGDSLILSGEPGGLVTIKAYAVGVGYSQSEVVTLTYQFSQNSGGIAASIESGSLVSYGTKVNLMTDITGAQIYYTTDGSSPTENGVRGTIVAINGTPGSVFTVKAVAVENGIPGIITTFIYRIKDIPAAPTASPGECTLTVATEVSLSSGIHKIYYTTDGTEPTKSSNLYVDPILVNRTTTLKAIAVSEDGEISNVATFIYKAAEKAEMPKADYADAQVLEPGTKVILKSETTNAKIYYTVDGTEPTLGRLHSIMEYDKEGIEINRSVTVKAVAYREDLQLSNVATYHYIVEKIPAVEMKEAEEARLAEEGLHDTDAGELTRRISQTGEEKERYTIKEQEHQTTITLLEKDIANGAVFVTQESDRDLESVSQTKKLFGDSYTILSSYKMRLKSESSSTLLNIKAEVGIPIPEGYENAMLAIVEVSATNEIKVLDTKRTDSMLYARGDANAEYAIVGPESFEETTESIPYLLILEIVSAMTLFGGIAYFVIGKVKKYRRNRRYYPNE